MDWPPWSTYLSFVLACVLVLTRPMWPLTRHAVTLVHEAGHAVTAVVTGRRLTGIRLHSDSSGLTLSRGKPSGPGMVLTAAAGYLAPSLLGLAGAALIANDLVPVLIWASIGSMVAMLLFIRNVFGVLVLLATGAVFGAVARYGSPDVQLQFGYVAVWLLLLGNARTIVEGARSRSGPSDIDQLRALTHLPRAVWIALLMAVAVGTGVLAWRAQYLR